jgi:hypothetical protein
MDDQRLVAAIVSGDPDGIAEAIDRYGPSLLAGCRAVLDLATADQVVLDTFAISRARLDGLTDPGKLEGWLHAVARGECARCLPPEPEPADGPGQSNAGTVTTFPQRLHGKILAVCTDETPTGRAERASLAHRAGPFGRDGFPRPARLPGQRGRGWRFPGWRGPGPRRRAGLIATSASVAAVAIVAVAVIALTGSHPGTAAAASGTGQNDGAGQGLPGGSPSGTSLAPGNATAKAGQHAAGTPSSGATASLQAAHTSAPPSPAPRSAGSPAPGQSASANQPSPSPSPTPPQAGTLVPSTNWLSVTSINNQEVSVTFVLTAQGGPVSYYAIATKAPGRVSITPQSGSIPAGGTVLITVTAHTLKTFTTPLTLSPDGGTVWLHVVAKLAA